MVRNMSIAAHAKIHDKPKAKTAILMLNMGGPISTDKVGDYLLKIMTDRDMIQLPIQR